jgi:arylsulfatase
MYLSIKRIFSGIFCLILFLPTLFPAEEKPNFLIILSDDMGYSDLGCYGSEISTPNLDGLAAGGLRFTQFYNTGRCCPTRASLLTGLYPHAAGLGWMTAVEHAEPGYAGVLNAQSITIAQALKTAGYQCYMAGKWHLCLDEKQVNRTSDRANWPLQRGFDRFYGTIRGAGSYFDPTTLARGNQLITPENDPEYRPVSYYYTDAISDHAIRYIKERDKGEPFFLYVSYTAPHWPMHALPEDIKKYDGMYDDGWESIREQRWERMKELGVIHSQWSLSEPVFPDWSQESRKGWMSARMEVYAAMIDRMDYGIGRIIQALKETGCFDNTLILFLQDNGGCAEEQGSLAPYDPKEFQEVEIRPKGPDELTQNLFSKRTRDGRLVRRGLGVMPGPADTFMTYGREWANVSNTPLRRFKSEVHEGGIATPLIAHWTEGIQGKGELRSQTGHLIDIMPTLLELAGTSYPEAHDSWQVRPLPGRSLVPSFSNQPDQLRAIFWEHETNRAVRVGKWKLVAMGNLSAGGYGRWTEYEFGDWELYDLERDRTETRNLAEQYPERVQELSRLWREWAWVNHVFPFPWRPD